MKVGSSTIYCRLVDGRFPKYRDVIPAKAETTIDLVVGPFYSAIRQAQIVTEEDSRGVDFRFSAGLLTFTSKSADVGQSVIQLPISFEGDELAILFDPRFIADFLRVLEPEREHSIRVDRRRKCGGVPHRRLLHVRCDAAVEGSMTWTSR